MSHRFDAPVQVGILAGVRKRSDICGKRQADGTRCTNSAGCQVPHPTSTADVTASARDAAAAAGRDRADLDDARRSCLDTPLLGSGASADSVNDGSLVGRTRGDSVTPVCGRCGTHDMAVLMVGVGGGGGLHCASGGYARVWLPDRDDEQAWRQGWTMLSSAERAAMLAAAPPPPPNVLGRRLV